ncbi:MAG: ankyrin repeat domain-containing protein [Thermodesulfobacteriota bacterium]
MTRLLNSCLAFTLGGILFLPVSGHCSDASPDADGRAEVAAYYQQYTDAIRGRDYPAAVLALQPEVAKGTAEALYLLGSLYRTGRGVERDYGMAAELFTRAAEQGSPDAQYSLGALYEKGMGIEQNLEEAKRLFRLASNQGNTLAGRKLQEMEAGTSALLEPGESGTTTETTRRHLGKDPEAELRWAAIRGYQEDVEVLLASGVNVDAVDAQGRSALIEAASNAHPAIAARLISHGASLEKRDGSGLNALLAAADSAIKDEGAVSETISLISRHFPNLECRDKSGNTPLLLAVKRGNASAVATLLSLGARPEATDQQNRTAAYYAANRGHQRIEKQFLTAGIRPEQTQEDSASKGALLLAGLGPRGERAMTAPSFRQNWSLLQEAAWKGQTEVLAHLCEKAEKGDIDGRDEHGQTALILASMGGHIEAAEVLLDHGADPNAQRNDGRTALLAAAEQGHPDLVAILQQAGADMMHLDRNGTSALILAIESGDEKTAINTLQLAPGLAGRTDLQGKSPLIEAAKMGMVALIDPLVAAGVEVDAADRNGRTALMAAATNGRQAAVETLLRHSAQVDRTDDGGNTPLMLAASHGHADTIVSLLRAGSDLTTTNGNGNTALLLAADRGATDIVILLLAKGADIGWKNAMGNTALMLATLNDHAEAVKVLLENGADPAEKNRFDERAISLAASSSRSYQLIEQFESQNRWFMKLL